MDHTIMVVEDNPGINEIVSDILESEGYRVVRAARADVALSMLKETRPDLILSDVVMPGMSGVTFYRRVRAEARWSQIPFVFLTGRGQQGDEGVSMGLGVNDYLVKPFEPEDLLGAVRIRLRRAAARQGTGGGTGADCVTTLPAPDGTVWHVVSETASWPERITQTARNARRRKLLNRLARGASPRGRLVADMRY
jgi:DNA-binding response OmpR family regulator